MGEDEGGELVRDNRASDQTPRPWEREISSYIVSRKQFPPPSQPVTSRDHDTLPRVWNWVVWAGGREGEGQAAAEGSWTWTWTWR